MKIRVTSASVHQNGKVFGLLMAAASLILLVPMFFILQFAPTQFDAQGNPVAIPGFLLILFPIVYLVMGYIGGVVSSFFYNLIAGFAGGFEFDLETQE